MKVAQCGKKHYIAIILTNIAFHNLWEWSFLHNKFHFSVKNYQDPDDMTFFEVCTQQTCFSDIRKRRFVGQITSAALQYLIIKLCLHTLYVLF